MSYDRQSDRWNSEDTVSIPLEQGNVLRLKGGKIVGNAFEVSIPLEQGNVLRPKRINYALDYGLNPFGTGQCLTTSN